MKKYFIIMLFSFSIIIGQDTLITKDGTIHSGRIVKLYPKYVVFSFDGDSLSTVALSTVLKLIDDDNQVELGTVKKSPQEVVGISTDKMIATNTLPLF